MAVSTMFLSPAARDAVEAEANAPTAATATAAARSTASVVRKRLIPGSFRLFRRLPAAAPGHLRQNLDEVYERLIPVVKYLYSFCTSIGLGGETRRAARRRVESGRRFESRRREPAGGDPPLRAMCAWLGSEHEHVRKDLPCEQALRDEAQREIPALAVAVVAPTSDPLVLERLVQREAVEQ